MSRLPVGIWEARVREVSRPASDYSSDYRITPVYYMREFKNGFCARVHLLHFSFPLAILEIYPHRIAHNKGPPRGACAPYCP